MISPLASLSSCFALARLRARWFAVPLALLVFTAFSVVFSGAAHAQQRWTARYSATASSNDSPTAIAADARGDVFVTGETYSADTGVDYLTTKYNGATGALLWAARYNGPRNYIDNAAAIAVDADNNVIVTGNSSGNGTSDDFGTIKYNGATGAQLWVARYNNGGIDAARAIGVDESGDVFVAGNVQNGFAFDFATVKYNGATGEQRWVSLYNGPGQNADSIFALVVDHQNNVIVDGSSQGSFSSADFATIKYNGQNGVQSWVARYTGPGSSMDSAKAIAVDVNDDVLVTGESPGVNGDYDYATVKYERDTGVQLWASRYDDAAHTPNSAYAIAVDAAGGVYVTGGGAHGGANPLTDAGTVKYDGATGAQQWVAVYNGPNSSYDSAYAIAIDNHGNVIVTGESGIVGDGASFDYITLRYNAGNGAQTGAARYDGGSADQGDAAVALALDRGGNVFVTGESNGDYLTIKYNAFTPPPLGPGYQALDIAAGNGVTVGLDGLPDASLRVLWGNAIARRTQVWSAQAGVGVNGYSPLFTGSPGFAGMGLSVSPSDNRSRVLWNNETARRAALYTVAPGLGGLETSSAYGPLANTWVVVDAQTGGDGKVRMLWRQPSTGKLALWRLNPTASAIEAGGSINPPAGYTLLPQIAVSPSDNKTRLAWIKSGASGVGQAAIWTMGLNLAAIEAGRTYAAANYALQGFGVGADNKVRLVWAKTNTSQAISLWTLPAGGANGVIESARAYTLPGGMRTARLRVSPANKYLLLVAPDNPPAGAAPRAEAWVISPNAQTRESVTPLGD